MKLFTLMSFYMMSVVVYGESELSPEISSELSLGPHSELPKGAVFREVLEGDNSRDVMLFDLTLPAQFHLPNHSHPVNEYLYVQDGSTVVGLPDQQDMVLSAGDSIVIPANQIHSATTHAETAHVMVVRIQPKGQPIINSDK